MHLVINRYAGAAERADAALSKVRQAFVPLLKGCAGFLGYTAIPTEQGDVVAISIWETSEALANSRDPIRGWAQKNLEGFEEPTERFSGEIAIHSVIAPEADDLDQPLYCLVRKLQGMPAAGSQRRQFEERLAAAEKLPGCRGMYLARSDADPTREASVLFCGTKTQAAAAHAATITMAAKHHPNLRVRVAASGQTAVLAMMECAHSSKLAHRFDAVAPHFAAMIEER